MIGTWSKEGTNRLPFRPALIVCCLCNEPGILARKQHTFSSGVSNSERGLDKESLFHPPVQCFPGIMSSFMVTAGRRNEEEGERYRSRANN